MSYRGRGRYFDPTRTIPYDKKKKGRCLEGRREKLHVHIRSEESKREDAIRKGKAR
jgi:hypothetical protein